MFWVFHILTILLLLVPVSLSAQVGATSGEWPTYGGNLASTRYSPLHQINASNFNQLQIAWKFKTEHLGPTPEYRFEATPLMVKGVLYTTGGSLRTVVALDPATGETLWTHTEHEGTRGSSAPRNFLVTE